MKTLDTVSCSLPGSCRGQWVPLLHTRVHSSMPHSQGKTIHDSQITRFCNSSSVNNCNFYLLPDSHLDLGGAGVSSQFRDKHSSVGLPEHTPTEPKGSWYGNWQTSKQGPKSRLICESQGPSAGCIAVTASSSLDQQENCTQLL